MTRESWRRDRREPIDDATIEQLVRDAAAGWTMPAIRLEAPGWRERVRSPRARRLDSLRGLLSPLGRAATAAVALTVVGAMVAVVITKPPTGPGKSAEPTGGATPAPSGAAAWTPLPPHLLTGGLPTPSTVLTEVEEGDFALVDLKTGDRGPSITSAAYGSVLRRLSDGTLLCLCVKTAKNDNTKPTEVEISLDRFDATGTFVSGLGVLGLQGDPDPRDGSVPERPPHVAFDLQFSADGRYGVIGWSVRKHPVWHNGITIIDLEDGKEVSHLDLPDDTTGVNLTRRVVLAPRMLDLSGDGSVVIAREWYSWSPPASEGGNFEQDTDVFEATLAAGVLSKPGITSGTTGCGQRVLRSGRIEGGGTWLVCARGFSNQLVVRRLDGDNQPLGDDATFSAATGVDGDTVALSPDGNAIFAWNPLTARIARVDLVTGAQTTGSGPAPAAADPGPLAALGAWLAPSAAAKTFLYGGIVVSPDGTRVYAIGIDPGSNEHDLSGSAGIFVFDAATLTSLGRWEPEADYISLGISADGRYVYAAGLPRVDAAGTSRPSQQASITVHAASDGTVQVVAGQLGGKFLMFSQPVLQ